MEKIRSISRKAALQMAVRIGIVIIVITVLAYWHTYRFVTNLQLDFLQDHTNERGAFENELFSYVEDCQARLKQVLMEKLSTNRSSDPNERFDQLF